jgi:hypothetical protein
MRKLEFVGRGDLQIPIHFLIKPAVNHLGEVPLKLVLKHSGFSSWRFHKALMARLGPLQSDVNRGLAISLRAVRRCDTDEDRALSDIADDGHRLGVPLSTDDSLLTMVMNPAERFPKFKSV